MFEDLKWFGIEWEEGPDRGGPFVPYSQSDRQNLYAAAFETLRQRNLVYPCTCSRQDVQRALQAPHLGEEEPIYPGTCRARSQAIQAELGQGKMANSHSEPRGRQMNWRFRVPDGELISFHDRKEGHCEFMAGQDFGDFIVWRHDQSPSYQLAVVVDDAAMAITEVVRGADLLRSTARQLLLYRALGLTAPRFYHCPLMTDKTGLRLAKRHDALSLRTLRQQGACPEKLRSTWE
jgi:glutamyl-tRNA synthetase